MTVRQPIRWGVIGLGVGNQHARALLHDGNAKLVSVCDVDPNVLANTSSAYGDVSNYTNAEEMLAAEDLDAVAVASYDWDHANTIAFALDHGIHVFAEKPIGTTREDYDFIAERLQVDRTIRLTTNTLLRRAPRFLWLKSEIDHGHLGRLVHVQADYLYGRLLKLTRGWRGTNPEYSVTLGGAIHMVDLLLWLAGERPISVSAIGSSVGLPNELRDGDNAFSGETSRLGLLTFASGMTASVSANFASVGPHFHRLDVYGTELTFMNLPTKSNANESAPGNVGLLLRGADPGTAEEVNVPYPDVPKSALLPEFNRALLGLGDSSISEQEAMDTLAVCLALDAAASSAHQVAIEYEEIPPRRYVQRPH